jgi:iron complex transport system substrate-binding protein
MAMAAPEVLVTTPDAVEAAGGVNAFLSAPGLAATPAARNRRLVTMDALYLLGFGPRLPQAIDELSRQLYDTAART